MNAATMRHLFRTFHPGEYGCRRQRLGVSRSFFEQLRIVATDYYSQGGVADRAFERSEFVAFGEIFNRRKLSLYGAGGAQPQSRGHGDGNPQARNISDISALARIPDSSRTSADIEHRRIDERFVPGADTHVVGYASRLENQSSSRVRA